MNYSDEHKYDDIINLEHLTSHTHPRMPMKDRAAQFAPFAALTGHDAEIKEKARLTDDELYLSDEVIEDLNEKLAIIKENLGSDRAVSITYFVPDDRKTGGAYVTRSGSVKKIDMYERALIMSDGTKILIGKVCGIEGEMFDETDMQQT